MDKIRLIELPGSNYEIGKRHAEQYGDDIKMFAKERVELCMSGQWSDEPLSRERVLEIADACIPFHEAYSPDLMDELRGMADVTGLSIGELIVVNGFTDFVDTLYAVTRTDKVVPMDATNDDCTAFLVPGSRTADSKAFYGQTWDMHDSATPYVLLLRVAPTDKPEALVFTITGCVGMIGMNSAGIAVGINNLMGGDGQIGVTWPFVIRKILLQDNLDDAMKCLTDAKLAGAHNFMLMDKNGDGYNVEAMSTVMKVTPLNGEAIVHTNHCVAAETMACEREREAASLAWSKHRLTSAEKLLDTNGITVDMLKALTNSDDVSYVSKPPFHVETCGAAIMQPATGNFWAAWGRPAEGSYEEFSV